jgi:hypothetical protein
MDKIKKMKNIENPYVALEENIQKKGNRPIFFIGSGMTRRFLNGPNWKGLLEELIQKNGINKPYEYFNQKHNNSFEIIASDLVELYFEKAWDDKINNTSKYATDLYSSKYSKDIFLKYQISSIFKSLLTKNKSSMSPSIQSEINEFAKTNPTSIITTNYDELLEKYIFKDFKTVVGQKVVSERIKGKTGRILKIHGCVTKPETIVISESDYEKFISKQKYLSAKLLTYFVEYPIIIMGYSLTDRNILGILETILDCDIYNGSTLNQKAFNIWFVNYSNINTERKDILLEKEIALANNKTLIINYFNVASYNKLFASIINTNKYPYSLSAIAIELGYTHWKQIDLFVKKLVKDENIDLSKNSEYCHFFTDYKRYSESFLDKLKERIN